MCENRFAKSPLKNMGKYGINKDLKDKNIGVGRYTPENRVWQHCSIIIEVLRGSGLEDTPQKIGYEDP